MKPNHSFLQYVSASSIFMLPRNFYNKEEKGSIILKKSSWFGFIEEGIILEGENWPIRTDVAILATGYNGDQKLVCMFESPIFQKHIARSPTSVADNSSSNSTPCNNRVCQDLVELAFIQDAVEVACTVPRPEVWLAQYQGDGEQADNSSPNSTPCDNRVFQDLVKLAFIRDVVKVTCTVPRPEFGLSSIKEMEKDVKAWEDHMKQYAGRNFRRSCIG
ncbi:hypothetical protein CRG98_014935 [Punica granatum]|uniref:Flavin-containing monooxygenase n=1 Tax=Punica granatum TaxID=22663 RepID=A0A2I0K842_PUNGR|nr:hypothetical protein CRG98_014935 [Punica granatum]